MLPRPILIASFATIFAVAGCGGETGDDDTGLAVAEAANNTDAVAVTDTTAPVSATTSSPVTTTTAAPATAPAATTATTVPATTVAAAATCVAGEIRFGDGAGNGRAGEVQLLQTTLGIPADGEFGPSTIQAAGGWALELSGDVEGSGDLVSWSPQASDGGWVTGIGLEVLGILCPGTPIECPQLSSGNRGPAVALLQEKLIAAGYGAPIESSGGPDGSFGAGTAEAIVAFDVATGTIVAGEEGGPMFFKPENWQALGYTCTNLGT